MHCSILRWRLEKYCRSLENSLELSLPVLYTANSIPVASPDFNFYLLNSGRLLTFTWIPPLYTAAWKLSPASKLENCRAHLVSLLSWINELCCLMSDFLFVWGKGINLASVNSATIRILHWQGVLYVKKMSLHIMLFHHFCCLFFSSPLIAFKIFLFILAFSLIIVCLGTVFWICPTWGCWASWICGLMSYFRLVMHL